MIRSIGRAAAVMMAALGTLAVPAPAAAQTYEELRACIRGCNEAYGDRPELYRQCTYRCNELYGDGDGNASLADILPALTRYS